MSDQSFTVFWISLMVWNIARLWICKGYTGCWISLKKPEYALMPWYTWRCLNNAENAWIFLHIPSLIYSIRSLYKLLGSYRGIWWWWWTVFVVWLTGERGLALFPARTINLTIANLQHAASRIWTHGEWEI